MNSTSYEMSKTYQYRKVMKPMLERKRRARINKCLDELKDLMADCVRQQDGGESLVKLEKADILEMTVQHLRKIKSSRQSPAISADESFRSGYVRAANEVSRALASLPKVDISLGTKLMSHLGHRLNQLQSTPVTALKVQCEPAYHTSSSAMLSPVSSGYGSDSEYSAPATPQASENASVWRPW